MSVSFDPKFIKFAKAGTTLLTNLLAYWKLDESSGTIEDAHGTHDSTANTGTCGASGKLGTCIDFSGTQYVTLADSADWTIAASDDITISAWIYWNSLTQGTYCTIFGTNSAPQFFLRNFGSGSARVSWWEGDVGSTHDPVDWSATTWYHIAVTKKVTAGPTYTCRYYVNGSYVGGDTLLVPGVINPTNVYIGGCPGGENFNGRIDELAIWKGRALTDEEILEVYNSGSGKTYPFS